MRTEQRSIMDQGQNTFFERIVLLVTTTRRDRLPIRPRCIHMRALLLSSALLSGSLKAQHLGVHLGFGKDLSPVQNTTLASSNFVGLGVTCSIWIHHRITWHTSFGAGFRTSRNTVVSDHYFLRTGMRVLST